MNIDEKIQSIDLFQVYMILLILFGGILLSSLMLLVERIVYRNQNTNCVILKEQLK